MTLVAIANAYVNCVELEERAQREAASLAEDVSILRSDLHALLMDALRDAHIPYADRSDAARIAFEIVQKSHQIA
jgi:hypothetical protein